MDQLFRKYLNSVLNPDEYSKVADFLRDEKNEAEIYSLLKPFWDKNLEDDSEVQKPNPELRNQILQAILMSDRKTAQRKLENFRFVLRIAAILVIGLIISTAYFFPQNHQNQLCC